MSGDKLEIWSQAGIEYEEGLNRFMNNAPLYEKFLKKFMDSNYMETLRKAIEKEDGEEAFHSAHTLKGVTGNLSMTALFKETGVVTDLLREGSMEQAKLLMPKVEEAYQKAVEAIANNIEQ